MKTVTVELVMSDNYGQRGQGYRLKGGIWTETEFRIAGSREYGRWRLCLADADTVSRSEQGGPLSQGPLAYLSEQASVISAHPMPKAELVSLAPGDLILGVCQETGFYALVRVKPLAGGYARNYPQLEILAMPPATEDHSAFVAEENAKPRVWREWD